MSLINQALKKEQQRRGLNLRDSIPDIPSYDSENTGNGLSLSTRKNSRSLTILLGFTGLGVVLLGLGGGFIYFGKSYLSQISAPQMISQAESSASLASNEEKSSTRTAIQILNEIESEIAVPPANPNHGPRVEAEEELGASANGNPDAATLDESAEEEPVAVEESLKPEFDFKIQDLIDAMQVIGFRSAGPNSRLLMNGRVFKLEDIVDNERGIRFLGSDGENLVFETPSGYRYRKPL